MSFDLAALAMDEPVTGDAAHRMYRRCSSGVHDDGEPDGRIVAFYEQLRSRYPDSPPYDPGSPWVSMPLDVGFDHVIMHLGSSPASVPAVEKIQELVARRRLVLYDPQSGDTYTPDG